MNITKTDVKDAVTLVVIGYVSVQAYKGWRDLYRGIKEVRQDAKKNK